MQQCLCWQSLARSCSLQDKTPGKAGPFPECFVILRPGSSQALVVYHLLIKELSQLRGALTILLGKYAK